MDLIAPNPEIMSKGITYVGMLLIMIVIGGLKRSTATSGPMYWIKNNAPLVSIVFGELWALMMYAIPALQTSAALDDYFVAGLWIAGGTSIIVSVVKDARDGSMTKA